MRALNAAASGMKGLQLKIDTIANNLANVNTTGFKKQRVEFKDLIYEKLLEPSRVNGEGGNVSIEIGQGVMTSATTRNFTEGTLQNTNNDLDVAINGEGFFEIKDGRGRIRYTRDGSFKISVEDGNSFLVTSDGYKVQGFDGDINLGQNITKVIIDKSGKISVTRDGEEAPEEITTFRMSKFLNPSGLEAIGSNLYSETIISGNPITNETEEVGEVWQGFIETSNVQVVDEMISMITAQRAYEINSKTIQTADKILELANNLRR